MSDTKIEALADRIKRNHPLQYGYRNGELVLGTENDDDLAIRERMNRCPVCEQWSPCDVRGLLEDRESLLDGARDVLAAMAARYGWTLIADPGRLVQPIHEQVAEQIFAVIRSVADDRPEWERRLTSGELDEDETRRVHAEWDMAAGDEVCPHDCQWCAAIDAAGGSDDAES